MCAGAGCALVLSPVAVCCPQWLRMHTCSWLRHSGCRHSGCRRRCGKDGRGRVGRRTRGRESTDGRGRGRGLESAESAAKGIGDAAAAQHSTVACGKESHTHCGPSIQRILDNGNHTHSTHTSVARCSPSISIHDTRDHRAPRVRTHVLQPVHIAVVVPLYTTLTFCSQFMQPS